MRDPFDEHADEPQDVEPEDAPDDPLQPRRRTRLAGRCGAPAHDHPTRARSGGFDKLQLIKQASAIAVRALGREPQAHWRPIAAAVLALDLLQSSDTEYFITRFSNLCGGNPPAARELAHFLRLRLLGFNPWGTGPEDSSTPTPRLNRVPGGSSNEVEARLRLRRENAYRYYTRARHNLGIDAWRRSARELRGPIIYDNFFSNPTGEEGEGWSADQIEGSEHIEFEVERRRTAGLLDEVIAKAAKDLRFGPLEFALLYSITERKDSGDEQESRSKGKQVDLVGVPHRKLPEYLAEWGIEIDVGFKMLEIKKRKLVKDLIAWCEARPDLLKKLGEALRSLRDLQASAWSAQPVVTAPHAAAKRSAHIAPVTITRPSTGQVEIVRFDSDGKRLAGDKEIP